MLKQIFTINNGGGIFNIEGTADNMKWGFYIDDTVKNLKINGEAPTEILELILNGEKGYVWYYENIEVEDHEIEDLMIEY